MYKLVPEVQAFIEGLELSTIPQERQETLHKLQNYLQDELEEGESVNLNFICTHNSRRSQLCQIWAYTAALYYNVDKIRTFSGGTEVTAFHSNAVRALKETGFHIFEQKRETNPEYTVSPAQGAKPVTCFSKVYNDPANAKPFAAVMTCADAEENCPFIPEAAARFLLKYEDPKQADGTAFEAQAYAERNRQIATEMLFLFSKIKSK